MEEADTFRTSFTSRNSWRADVSRTSKRSNGSTSLDLSSMNSRRMSRSVISDAAVVFRRSFRRARPNKRISADQSGSARTLVSRAIALLDASTTASSSGEIQKRANAAEDSIISPGGSRNSATFVQPRSSRSARNDLSSFTMNKLNFQDLGVFGRDSEIQQLNNLYRKCRGPICKETEVVFLSGTSGTGKSRLVAELQPVVKKTPGFFVQGKFDFQQKGQPYSGIASACRELCQQIVQFEELAGNNSGATYEDFRKALTEELGTERQLLTEVIPGLREIFGFEYGPLEERSMKNDANDVDKLEGKNRFNFAFRRFMRVVTKFGPLVLVLDDLQWADSSTLDILEVLIRDVDNASLMVLGCYRSNEVDESHLVSKLIRDLKQQSKEDCVNVTEISIGNLGVKETNELISSLLSVETERTERLSEIVHDRTHGNVFYSLQLIVALQIHDLIQFNFGHMAWTWDEKEIEDNTRVTTNVVDLMLERLTKDIDASVSVHLPVAAYLGSSFKASTFQFITSTLGMEEVMGFLDKSQLKTAPEEGRAVVGDKWFGHCCGEGIIEPCGDDSFRFVHDKIREAAVELVAPDKRDPLGFCIGTILLESPEATDDKEGLFVTVNLLNMGVTLITDDKVEERLALAKLNLEAGRNSLSLSAFDASSDYLQLAMDLLPPNHWTSHYELSLSIFNLAADAAYCISDWDKMTQICETVVSQQKRPISDKYHAHRLILEALVIRSKFHEAEDKCLATLKLIGCTFPKGDFLQTVSLIKGVMKAKKLVAKTKEEDIRDFPLLKNHEKQFGLLVMETLTAAALGTGSKMLALPLLRQFEWVFKYGLSPESNVVFSGIGLILTAIMGELKLGQKCSLLAELIYERTGRKSTESRMLVCRYGLTVHMIEPFSDCMQRLLDGYKSGMEIGDLNYGMWSIQLFLMLAQCSGRSLTALNEDYPVYLKQMRDADQQPAADFGIIHWQAIHNLIGIGGIDEDPTILTGDVMEQEPTIRHLKEAKKGSVLDLLDARRVYLGCYFGKHLVAADLALKLGEKFYQNSPGWPTFVETFYFGALSCISAYKETKKKKYLRYAKAQQKKIKSWLKQGSASFLHWGLLLDSELASLKSSSQMENVDTSYQKAALAAAHTGRLHEQGLARVRFGEYLLSVNRKDDAMYQLKQARRLFDEWGAKALALRLANKYPTLREVPTSLEFNHVHIISSRELGQL